MKKISLIIITILMFFKNAAHSNYEKIFLILRLSIYREKLSISVFIKIKQSLLLILQASVVLQNNMRIYKLYGKNMSQKGSLFLGFHQIHSIKKREMMKKLKSFVK